MIEHITRWTHASIKDFIKKNFSGIPLIVEGEDDKRPDLPFFCELRIDGPTLTEHGTRGEFIGLVEINVIITVKKDEKYVHIIQDKIGLVSKVLNQCIPIKRIGSEESIDDGSFVTTLQLAVGEPIDVSNFGQIDSTVRVQQASVEANYRMQLRF
jgi:hypothetical protein